MHSTGCDLGRAWVPTGTIKLRQALPAASLLWERLSANLPQSDTVAPQSVPLASGNLWEQRGHCCLQKTSSELI